jgi:cbb3-type cytochrome c oxidase subunit III
VRAAIPVKLSRPLLAGALAIGVAVAAAACGTGGFVKGGDVTHGKQLFTQKCASCHTLAAAGSTATIGPNLDNAFSADRKQGFASSSIQEIVADQIRLPLQGVDAAGLTNVSPTGTTIMPANIVSGKDLTDVSAFVARCAGNSTDTACSGEGKITSTDGKTIFLTAGCTGCHTLKDAGSSGTVGPNLDEKKPPESLVIQRVTNGKGAMPSFKGKLTLQQIQAVAKYVSSVAGK